MVNRESHSFAILWEQEPKNTKDKTDLADRSQAC